MLTKLKQVLFCELFISIMIFKIATCRHMDFEPSRPIYFNTQKKYLDSESEHAQFDKIPNTSGPTSISQIKTKTLNEQILGFLRLLQEGATRRFGDLTEEGKTKLLVSLIPCLIPVIYMPILWVTTALLFYPLSQVDQIIREEESKIPEDGNLRINELVSPEEEN